MTRKAILYKKEKLPLENIEPQQLSIVSSHVSQVIESLIAEKFSTQRNFSELTIDQISETLESTNEQIESSTMLLQEADLDSFERAKEHFCSLLMIFEMHNFHPGYDETLLDLKHRTQPTRIENRKEPREQNNPPLTNATSDDTLARSIVNANDIIELQNKNTATESEEAGENTWVGELGLDSLWDSGPTQSPTEQPSQSSDPTNPAPSKLATEYWQVSSYLNSLRSNNSSSLPESHLVRLIIQNSCSCIKADVFEKLKPSLSLFWPDRQAAISRMLKFEGREIKLNPELNSGLWELARTPYALNLKLPDQLQTQASLIYFLSAYDFSMLEPSLADLSVLLLTLCQNVMIGNFQVQNLMNATGITEPECLEICSTLIKLHESETKTISINPSFSSADSIELENTINSLLPLIKKITVEEATQTRTT